MSNVAGDERDGDRVGGGGESGGRPCRRKAGSSRECEGVEEWLAGNVRPPERLVGRADEPSLQLRLPFMIADIRAVLRCRTSLPRLIVSSLV